MAKLPMKKAADLAKTMAKHGIPGSISMAQPVKMPKDKMPMDDAEEPMDDEKPEMEHCLEECADAYVSGDKEAIVSALRDLVDCIKHEDESQDMGE
jgi:hypothetical protein